MRGIPHDVVKNFGLILLITIILFNGDPLRGQSTDGLYFFTNAGCRPCQQLKPVLRGLAMSGYPITLVDTTQYPQYVQQFQISSTPTIVLVKNQREVKRHSGLIDARTVESWFQSAGFTQQTQAVLRDNQSAPVLTPQQRDRLIADHDRERNRDQLSGDRSTIHKGTRTPGDRKEQVAMDATVRIRVEDAAGFSYATGTVIHCHNGEWLVLTCGHVFRDSRGRGEISVEYDFADDRPVRAPARLISYDAGARDIGLIAVSAGVDKTPVQVATRKAKVDRGLDVFSIGCDHGEPPTIRRTRVKRKAAYDKERVVKYDIYGRPVDGRSGGGLFNDKGEIIGVCNAACVDFDEGIYTALDTIYWQIDEVRLAHLFQERPNPVQFASTNDLQGRQRKLEPSRQPSIDSNPQNQLAGRARPESVPRLNQGQRTSPGRNPIRPVDSRSQVASANSSDMEVILIVRSKSDPTRTEAITLSDPSQKLLRYLEKVGNQQTGKSRIDMAQLRHQLGAEQQATRSDEKRWR